ncbi:hypothetical protein CsatA_019891 [Cannabis sativa]
MKKQIVRIQNAEKDVFPHHVQKDLCTTRRWYRVVRCCDVRRCCKNIFSCIAVQLKSYSNEINIKK